MCNDECDDLELHVRLHVDYMNMVLYYDVSVHQLKSNRCQMQDQVFNERERETETHC